jgi:hypothetical protein
MRWARLGLALAGGIIFVVSLAHDSFVWMGIGVVLFVVGVIPMGGGGGRG